MYEIILKITPHVLNTHSKMTYKNNVPYVQMRFWQAQNYMQKLHLGMEKTLFTNPDRYLISMGKIACYLFTNIILPVMIDI